MKINRILFHPLTKNAVALGLVYLAVVVIASFFLKNYTHHGERLQVPNFVDENLEVSKKLARDNKIRIVVEDSLFVVGSKGGLVLEQNPTAGSYVKENRKIYVTVTKHQADKFKVAQLPDLYGKNFEQKKRELLSGFEIKSEVVGYEYDQGNPDQILRVLYDGKEIINSNGRRDEIQIEMGTTLEFILSKSTEGSLYMPDVRCQTLEEARFYLRSLNLHVGDVIELDHTSAPSQAYVTGQKPTAKVNILTGDTVTLYISNDRPLDCE